VLEIRRAAQRAESVTRQLLAFSRKQLLEPRVFSLADTVRTMADSLGRLLSPAIKVMAVAPVDLPSVYGDPGQIEQAILNLAVNARDAMPDGGQLTFVVATRDADEAFTRVHQPMKPGTYVELTVSDTGHGMDADTRSKAFEPFFTTKEVGKGTGLGLSMVYGTVKQSGGFIFVDSAPGAGSTFRLYFPPAEAPARETIDPAALAHGARARVLVVDDERAVRALVVSALKRRGHDVREAESADAARGVLSTGTFDLLLTDANMPGMNGVDLARLVAAEQPNLRIIVMSGFAEEALALGDLRGRVSLLPKPFTSADLQARVAETLVGRLP
jgi:CheY-like chemotaxis protein